MLHDDDLPGPGRDGRVGLRRGGDDRRDGRAQRHCEGHCGEAGAAAGAGDEHPFARDQPAAPDQPDVRSQSRDGEGCGLRRREGGQGAHGRRGDRHPLGEQSRASADDDLPSDQRGIDACADCGDRAAALDARDERQRRRILIATGEHQHVGVVERRVRDRHGDLARPRRRRLRPVPLQAQAGTVRRQPVADQSAHDPGLEGRRPPCQAAAKAEGERAMRVSLGEVFAAVCRAVPPGDAALLHGDKVTTWGDFDRRTDALAATFLAAGATPGDRVAHLLRNGPAYAETAIATLKARLVHVNVNYRYTGEELFYILDNSDAAVVVYDPEFAPLIAALAPRLPQLKLALEVGPAFETAAASGRPLPPQAHSPDDRLFIYTGGTTGYPKGVMWAQGDLWLLMGGGAPIGAPPLDGLDTLLGLIAAGEGRTRSLILPPQMHGTGLLTTLSALARGGSVVTLPSPGFAPLEALAACAAHAPDGMAIVGDAFARPLLAALDAGAGSIASLRTIVSSGTMWSPEVKAGLIRHNPDVVLLDALSSSESLGIGVAVTSATSPGGAARFTAGPETIVVDDALRPVAPGETGRLARGGMNPLGYWKDEARSAATFPTIAGKRYSVAGDFARLEADGSITLLGRGSHCINTGGEKVFPEEVEEALKTHPGVDDALVFGVADDRWGQAVTAVVSPPGSSEAELLVHLRTCLAPYKAPKRIVAVTEVPRAPNGKADYARARELAAATS